MQARIALKIGIVLLISLLLTIPLAMIGGLIGERQQLRDGVIRDIAKESVDGQQITGPVVIVPYKRRWIEANSEEREGKVTTTRRERVAEGKLAFLPESLTISGELRSEERYRGIYKATLYETALAVAGRFVLPAEFGITASAAEYEFGAAELTFGVSDSRGIGGGLRLIWQGAEIEFQPGANAPGFGSGVTAPLGQLGRGGGAFDFAFVAALKGLERIDFIPTGKENTVRLRSSWPDPSFYGRYLPAREVTPQGFSAEWRTSFLSTNVKQRYERCIASAGPCAELSSLAYGVALFRPVDIYQQLERSAKYGFLFIGLTFIVFFLYEVLKRLAIHPVQYLLVGAALAIFYLLLTSLSEQIAFALAYAVSAGACVALIGFYVSYVLKSVIRSAGFTAMLAALYAGLYVLVRAEEHALIMGSIALFFILAIVMIGTRKIDWYSVETLAVARKAAE